MGEVPSTNLLRGELETLEGILKSSVRSDCNIE